MAHSAELAPPAVALEHVRKRFGDTIALADVSLAVREGEMLGVIGPDGAGKTTLLRLACGLIAPDAGRVTLFGADPYRAHGTATSVIGYVSQQFSLYGDLSIDENIEFRARLHGVGDFAARRTRLLQMTGLEPFRARLADRLSGGMKQKLALACTLVHQPRLLVLDEPTTGVDPVSRREFWKLLAEFLGQGLTILLATPYLDEAERCGRVLFLSDGRAIALDEPARLQAGVAGLVLEIVAPEARRALDRLRAIVGPDAVQLFGDRLHVNVAGRDAARSIEAHLAEAGLTPVSVREILPSLEDVFVERLAASRAPH
jgi:ABC-2 type transport system ATP-binding protein